MKAKADYFQPPPWFRLWNDLADDPKIRRVTVLTGQPELIIIGLWVKLLILANKSPIRGELRVTIDLPYTLEEISYELRLDLADLEAIFAVFLDDKIDMIHQDGDCFVITHFLERQPKSDTDGAERVQRYRQRQKTKRYRNVTVTPPDTETDKETDKETDTDKDTDKQHDAVAEKNLYWIGEPKKSELLQLSSTTPELVEAWLEWYKKSDKPRSLDNPVGWAIRKIEAGEMPPANEAKVKAWYTEEEFEELIGH